MFLSKVNPLCYLVIYLSFVPLFGILFATLQPHGFYAPYARYEPEAVSDTEHLAATLKAAIWRSFSVRQEQQFIVDDWQLDLSSLAVDHVQSLDGTQLSFRVKLNAEGIRDVGARQLGWAMVATVNQQPTSIRVSARDDAFYGFPFSGFLWLRLTFQRAQSATI